MNETENQTINPVPQAVAETPVMDPATTDFEETKEPRVAVVPPKKKRRVGRWISNIIFFILFAIVLIEAILGFVNMSAINDGKEPVWCLSQKQEENKNEIITTYHLGLYKIIKIESKDKVTTTLKPFFIN